MKPIRLQSMSSSSLPPPPPYLLDFSAATSGAAGAVFSTAVMYPLDTVKTRLSGGREGGLGVLGVANEVVEEGGIAGFFKGLEAKLAQSVLQKFVYFYSYNALKRWRASSSSSAELSLRENLLLGYLAGLSSVLITTPVEVVQTRLQVGLEEGSLLGGMKAAVEKEGLGGLYKGLGTNVFLCVNPAIEYTAFDQLKSLWISRSKGGGGGLSAGEAFCLGAAAKAIATVVTYPYVRAKVLQQTEKEGEEPGEGAGMKDRRDAFSLVVKMVQEGGVSSPFRGIGPQLLKGVLTSALMLMTKEQVEGSVKRAVLKMLLNPVQGKRG